MRGLFLNALAIPLTALAISATALATTPDLDVCVTEVFGFGLLQNLHTEGANTVASPFSAQQALLLAATGAAGKTQAEVLNTLGLQGYTVEQIAASSQALLQNLANLRSEGVDFSMANGVWLANNLKVNPSFNSRVTQQLYSTFQSTNFADSNTAADINGVVRDATHGKFTEIVKADEIKDWVFALLNAVYFKANWRNKFDRPLLTAPFYIDAKTQVDVTYMSKVDRLQVVNRDDGSTAVAIPYGKSDDLRLILILPFQTSEIPSTLQGLAKGNYSQITAQLNPAQISPEKVEFFMPPFEFRNSHDLIQALKSMGLIAVFTPEADFQGMTPEDVFVTAAKQLAMGRVDQNGSEFAAATIIGGMRSTSMPRPPRVLRFDRPFIFSLDYKGTPLFAGVLSNPLEAANHETAGGGKDIKPGFVIPPDAKPPVTLGRPQRYPFRGGGIAERTPPLAKSTQPAPATTHLTDTEIIDEALKTAPPEEQAEIRKFTTFLLAMKDFLKKHDLHEFAKITLVHKSEVAPVNTLILEVKFTKRLTPQQKNELNLLVALKGGSVSGDIHASDPEVR